MLMGPMELIILGIFLAMFVGVAIVIGIGFFTTFRLSSKVFHAVERELDRKALEQAAATQGQQKCAHCGTTMTEERCTSCGARAEAT